MVSFLPKNCLPKFSSFFFFFSLFLRYIPDYNIVYHLFSYFYNEPQSIKDGHIKPSKVHNMRIDRLAKMIHVQQFLIFNNCIFFFSLSLATEPIVAPPAADDATSQHTATQGFTYDPASGYYYDANTGLYYDSNTGVNEID